MKRLRRYEDFVWFEGRVWRYDGQYEGIADLTHPTDTSLGTAAPLGRIRKVSKKDREAILWWISYEHWMKTDPRLRGRRPSVHNPRPRRLDETLAEYVRDIERERRARKRSRRARRVAKKKGKRRNPHVDIRVVPDDDDPELHRGYLVIPVTKAAKIWISWVKELLRVDEIEVLREPDTIAEKLAHLQKTGRPWWRDAPRRTVYWVDKNRVRDLMEDLKNAHMSARLER